VKHEECSLTSTGSSFVQVPFTSAACSIPLLIWRKGINSNSPISVGSFTLSPFSIMESLSSLYLIRSLIAMIFIPNFCLSISRSGSLAIEPSSFIISTNAPPGRNPARRVRSTTASVCPARLRTPFDFAFSGNICPGLPRSEGFVPGSTSAFIVIDLSFAETPVVVSGPRRSTVTVNWVSCRDVLFPTIRSSSSSSQRSSGSATQIRPRPCLAMKFTISGVISSAEQMKSPSFSLSSSSTTIRSFPFLISSIPSSIVLSLVSIILMIIALYMKEFVLYLL